MRTPATRGNRRTACALGLAAGAALFLGACGSNSSSTNTGGTGDSSGATLTETGSSLLAPLFAQWAISYHSAYPSVSITSTATSSGVGITDAATGTADIGASDAYLPPADSTTYPGIENIPLAISAQQINYNVPGIAASTHLKLDATVLAEMYTGKISNWDDPAIADLNPGVKLPNLAIHTIHRSDSSGDTFLFTTFLSDGAPSDWSLGYSTSITFPSVPNSVGALKNSGMLAACQATPGCVAYIGISYLQKTQAAGLGEADLENKSGSFELPTPTTISAAAASFPTIPVNGALSMIWSSGKDAYPIINFEYAIVLPSQLSSAKVAAVKALLSWVTNPADGSSSKFLSAVNFVPLPTPAVSVASALIAKI